MNTENEPSNESDLPTEASETETNPSRVQRIINRWFKFQKKELENTDPDQPAEISSSEDFDESRIRVYKLGITIALAIIVLIIALPFLADSDSIKSAITSHGKKIFGDNFTIAGKAQFTILPSPAITLDEVSFTQFIHKNHIYQLHAGEVKLEIGYFRFFSAIFGAGKIVGISLSDGVIKSRYATSTDFKENPAQISSELRQGETSNALGNNDSSLTKKWTLGLLPESGSESLNLAALPTIKTKDMRFIFYDQNQKSRSYESIDSTIVIGENHINAKGSFISNDLLSKFKLSTKFHPAPDKSNKADSIFEIVSDALKLKISGRFVSGDSLEFSGQAEGNIADLRSFYKTYLIGSKDLSYENIAQDVKGIKLSAKVLASQGKIAVSEFLIDSDLINGEGSADIDFSSKIPVADLRIALERIELTKILLQTKIPNKVPTKTEQKKDSKIEDKDEEIAVKVSPSTDQNSPLKKTLLETKNPAEAREAQNGAVAVNGGDAAMSTGAIDNSITPEASSLVTNGLKDESENEFRSDLDLTAEIRIRDLIYNQYEVNDLSMYLMASNGAIAISPLTFKIPGDSLVRINGLMKDNMSSFTGKLDINGRNLGQIAHWIDLKSENIMISQLSNYSLYSDISILPNVITFDNIYLNLNTSEILGKIRLYYSNITSNIISDFHIDKLNLNDYILTSDKNSYFSRGSLIKKLFWLNDISSNNEINLKIDKLSYENEEFINPSVKLRVGQGYLDIVDLSLTSEVTDLLANLSVDLTSQNPSLQIIIEAKKLNFSSTLSSPIPIDPEQTTIISNNSNVKTIADYILALPSFEGLRGEIKLNSDQLSINENELGKLKVEGKFEDGSLTPSAFSFDVCEGKFNYTGTIALKNTKVISGGVSFRNISLQPCLAPLLGIENIGGIANIDGSIQSFGNNKREFVKNLSGNVKFRVASPAVENYGLADLVKEMFAPRSYISELSNPEKVIEKEGAITIFKEANGEISLIKDAADKFKVNFSAPGVNGIIVGSLDIPNDKIDASSKTIFALGTAKKPIQITLASGIKGEIEDPVVVTNLDQVRQYLGLPTLNVTAPIKAGTANTASVPVNPNTNNRTTPSSKP